MAMELKIIEQVQKFTWNFDEIKNSLAEHIEQYANLVVNDENLKSMEKTQKEIASLRIKITKFKTKTKGELDKPYKIFEHQVKELLNLVESAEKPIKDQLEIYEDKRREQKSIEIQDIMKKVSAELGLTEKYSSQMVIDEKWLNRTQKKSDTLEEIQQRVCWFLDVQQKDIEAETFLQQKIEMAKFMVESLSAGLITPLTFEEIENRIDSLDIGRLKLHIEEEVARRRAREERAKQLAEQQMLERQEQERRETERIEAKILESERLEEERKAAELVQKVEQPIEVSEEITPEIVPEPIALFDVKLCLCKVTQEDIDAIFDVIKVRGIKGKRTIALAE